MSPNHVDCYRGLSILLVDKGQPDKGFTLLKDWAMKNPGLSDPRIELAKLHQEFNQNKVAEQYLNEALTMDPNNPRAWAAKGRSREASGDLMMAIQNYEQSLALNAAQPEVYQRVGALKVRLSQAAPTNIASQPGPGMQPGTGMQPGFGTQPGGGAPTSPNTPPTTTR